MTGAKPGHQRESYENWFCSNGKTVIEIIKGDITFQNCDAIVNAANTSLLAGGGVCGAIFAKAGYNELQRACNELSPIKTGEAVATPGFNLKAKYVIHTAGPIYKGNSSSPLLRNSYINSLKVAEELKLESIAFPSISTGIYGYPLIEAAKIAISALTSFEYSSLKLVRMVCFDQTIYDVYKSELQKKDM